MIVTFCDKNKNVKKNKSHLYSLCAIVVSIPAVIAWLWRSYSLPASPGEWVPNSTTQRMFRLAVPLRPVDDWKPLSAFFLPSEANIFQKRSVSSAAPEHTAEPSGLVAMCSTRDVWPLNSFTRAMVGYFHKHSWFSAKPWLILLSEYVSFGSL